MTCSDQNALKTVTSLSDSFLFFNGPVYTMVPDSQNQPMPETVLVKKGIIAFTGTFAELHSIYSKQELSGFKEIDLNGRPLFPGFCDNHTHFMLSAEKLASIDLTGLSHDETAEKIAEMSKNTDPDQWITGHGWDLEDLFKDLDPGLIQNMTSLMDKACPNPVYLISKDAHGSLLNKRALQAALKLKTLPEKCSFHKINGNYSGLVFEQVFDLKELLVPPLSNEMKRKLSVQMADEFFSKGITFLQTNERPEDYYFLKRIINYSSKNRCSSTSFKADSTVDSNADFPAMICNFIFSDTCELKKNLNLFNTSNSDDPTGADMGNSNSLPHIVPGGVKLFMDGSLGSRTAAMTLPYRGTENDRGLLTITDKELVSWLEVMKENHLFGVFHSIGDKASLLLLELLKKFWPDFKIKSPQANRFHQIEHFQFLNKKIMDDHDFKNLILSVQPSHLWHDHALLKQHLHMEAQKYSYLYRSMIQKGSNLVFGSDSPVETIDPWPGISAAVSRISRKHIPNQALTLLQAIKCHTVNPSKQLENPFKCGTITPGNSADLTVFNVDPFKVAVHDETALKDSIKCSMTFFRGKMVYSN